MGTPISIKPVVLIVDDLAITRELLASLLQTAGFEVVAAATGEQGLLILCNRRKQVEWLVTRVRLPGLVCGWILKDEFRRHHPEHPVVMLDGEGASNPILDVIFQLPTAPMQVLQNLQRLAFPHAGRRVVRRGMRTA